MDNLQLYWQSEEALELLISAGIPLIVIIALTIVTALLGAEAVAQIRAFVKRTRKYIDEPTDKTVLVITGVGELIIGRDIPEETTARLLRAVYDALGEAKPLAERVPLQEHITNINVESPRNPDAVAKAVRDVERRAKPQS